MPPGTPFSCRHCGEVVYTPGQRKDGQQDKAEMPFGQMAVQMGFLTPQQLAAVLKEQKNSKSHLRLGDLLVQKGLLNSRQVTRILQAQGAQVAHLLPGYEIVEKLGEGGMGAVYKGVHLASRKTVAIKVLAERLARRREFLERFHREARVAIDLDHPNIVKGFDEGMAADIHYFVMEYVHGKSAARLLKRHGRFSERRALDIARQVASALEYAHQRKLVHRDIKPDNLMIMRDGRVKIADYGLVKYADDLGQAGLTAEGQIMGTPNYISPEQARGEPVDIRSDIYGLGATLYHLLTGQPPYQGTSSMAIIGMHARAPVPDPQKAHPELSDAACAIVRKMMAKDPAERFQDPAELLAALATYRGRRATRDIASQASSADIPATPTGLAGEDVSEMFGEEDLAPPEAGEERSLSRLTPYLFVFAILLLTAGIGAALYHLRQKREKTAMPGEIELTRRRIPPAIGAETAHEIAAASYKEAMLLQGAQRAERLREIIARYPNTPAARQAQDALAALGTLSAQQPTEQKETEDPAKLRMQQAERELAASQAYSQACERLESDPANFETILGEVIRGWPGTRAAAEAERKREAWRLRRIEARKPKAQAKDATAVVAEEDRLRQEHAARTEFMAAYRQCLRAYDLDTAEQRCRELKEKPFPALQQLADACLEDIADLKIFLSAMEKIFQAQVNHNITISIGNSPRRVLLKAVEDGEISFVLSDRFVMSRAITDLAVEDIERFLRQGYKQETPAAELLLALHCVARQDVKRAAAFFAKLGDRDPRRRHHEEMLRWE